MSHATKIALGAIGIGYLAGAGAGSGDPHRGQAEAGLVWDEASKSFVTGEGQNLTFWKVDGDKVVGATSFSLASQGAVQGRPGADGRPGQLFPAGNYIFSKGFKPAPAGMPPPSSMMRTASRPAGSAPATAVAPAARAPVPMPPPARVPFPPGGQMSCGGGRCG